MKTIRVLYKPLLSILTFRKNNYDRRVSCNVTGHSNNELDVGRVTQLFTECNEGTADRFG
jgi:hypothetical protein